MGGYEAAGDVWKMIVRTNVSTNSRLDVIVRSNRSRFLSFAIRLSSETTFCLCREATASGLKPFAIFSFSELRRWEISIRSFPRVEVINLLESKVISK